MNFRILSLLLGLLLSSSHFYAQQVSTLIDDPTREFAALHWHPDGRIYAVDYFNGRLYQIYKDGSVKTLVSDFTNLAGGGFDSQGRFYFAGINSGTIYRLNGDNSYTPIGNGFKQPVGVLARREDDDILYVTEFEGNRVSKLSISTGVRSFFAGGNGIKGPDAILYDEAGDLIVSNWSNHKIHKIDAAGTVRHFATIPESNFMGYVDRIGENLYVPSFSGRTLYRIDKAGNAELIAGTGSISPNGTVDGPGDQATFARPNGTCHNPAGDTLLVSDDHKIRIITNFAGTTSANAELPLAHFNLSPNPASDVLQISFTLTTPQALQWEIIDAKGQQLAQADSSKFTAGQNDLQISIEHLIPGIYTLRVLDEQHRRRQFSFVKS